MTIADRIEINPKATMGKPVIRCFQKNIRRNLTSCLNSSVRPESMSPHCLLGVEKDTKNVN
ncbi:MAG: hypothetical protein COZ69_08400 [Deltaproteobacteria bacterium CG_4_8_14_3_um_filter_45_9]|nr:MAG: hypothetical protein COS40_01595 [Deltaproteobacteria bacterium CG03_land_8_20_14_0_80_45_14]PIX23454.1 MAG: hypothetical protein COZ69_08400 [Deltaproteobacteria bacterium CG_4_8_14_3_um_filter_45_9]